MNLKTETVLVRDIPVTLLWKRGVRTLRLRVLSPDGRVCATAPWWTTRREVFDFLSSRYEWMQQAVKKVTAQAVRRPSYSYTEGELHLLFGQHYPLHLQHVTSRKEVSATFDGQRITLHVLPVFTLEQRALLLQTFYKERLYLVVSAYMKDFTSRLACPDLPFRILRRKSVWGTFNVRTRSIIYNLSLALTPLECIQYVVLHEMTHQYVHAHNAEFYQRISVFMPDWKQRRATLKAYGRGVFV